MTRSTPQDGLRSLSPLEITKASNTKVIARTPKKHRRVEEESPVLLALEQTSSWCSPQTNRQNSLTGFLKDFQRDITVMISDHFVHFLIIHI